MESVAGLVLAAGEGRRFGGPKAPAIVDGERLVDRAVRILREAGCSEVVVVLGAWVGEVPGATVIENPDWASGMGSSLRAGLTWLEQESSCTKTVVTLVDLPGLTSVAIARVADCPGDIAVAVYDGERGHPVAIARRHWPEVIESARGDRGARDFLRGHADEVVVVEVGDVATGEDLDEPA